MTDYETALVKDIPRVMAAKKGHSDYPSDWRQVQVTSVKAFLDVWNGYLDNGWTVERVWR